MAFTLIWTEGATATFESLRAGAEAAVAKREQGKRAKATKQEALFKQVVKCAELLAANPRHPGLQTHEYHSIENPYDAQQKVFEAYVQNRTAGAYRLFWCYGPRKGEITVIAITAHP